MEQNEIIERIRQLIETRSLKPGDAIPTTRELAEVLDVSQPELSKALQALWSAGELTWKQGNRYRVGDGAPAAPGVIAGNEASATQHAEPQRAPRGMDGQAAQEISQLIATGGLPQGKALPVPVDLLTVLSCSPTAGAVWSALRRLVKQGLLVEKDGKFFPAPRQPDEGE